MLGVAEYLQLAQVHRIVAGHGRAPAVRHGGDGFRLAGQVAAQGILEAAVNNALAGQGLVAAQGVGFQQQALVTGRVEPVDQPQAGDAAAEDQNVGFQRGVAHGSPSEKVAAMLA